MMRKAEEVNRSDAPARRRLAARGQTAERQALLAGLEFLRPRALARRGPEDARGFARRLREERRAFAVADERDWLFAAFQFEAGGKPKRWVGEVVELFLEHGRDEWQLLEFLAMPHVLLGASPAILLDSQSARLSWLAEWELEIEAG